MNYIGSKYSLLPFIDETIRKTTGLADGTICDLFAGTGAVGAYFKKEGWRVIANDLQHYSYVRNCALLLPNGPLSFNGLTSEVPGLKEVEADARAVAVCAYLNALPAANGFIYSNYTLGGTKGQEFERLYFSDENGGRCDAIRQKLGLWHKKKVVSEPEFDYLLACLLEAIDKVANTASVYGAYLKKLKASALKPLKMEPLPIIPSDKLCEVHCEDANTLIQHIEGNVLYLDPPYNSRQYSANYHMLETISRYDNPTIKGKTGLRNYDSQKSAYSSRRQVAEAFRTLVEAARFDWIFLSYNNEGLLSPEDIETIMSGLGDYGVATKEYGRFRADRDSKERNYKADTVTEYLHYVKVS